MNKISQRLNIIFSQIPPCKKFADVGCDHGYVSLKMLQENRCKSLIFSDVSAPSLEKAKILLAEYKNAKGVLCDGLDLVDTDCDCVLIAGMGGENVIGILSKSFLPKTLVLQPMKNVDKLRAFLIEKGYKIEKDFLFKAEGKFYNLIVATLGQDSLTEEEIIYGRDNLKNPSKDFLEFLENKINKNKEILGGLSGEKFTEINDQVTRELALYERLRTKR